MLSANGSITVYHFDEESEQYTRQIIKGASVFTKCGAKFSDRGDGFVYNNKSVIRIWSADLIDITTNDYILIGAGSEELDRSRCFKVTSVTDNRRGLNKHLKIECV